MTMRALSPAEIDWYLDTAGGSVLGSVGAYQVEGLGIRLFSRIEGDHFAVLGLPMIPLIAALRRLGAIAP
jgi:septum formation protein